MIKTIIILPIHRQINIIVQALSGLLLLCFPTLCYNVGKRLVVLFMIDTIKIGRKSQMVLPSKIRKAMNISEGDEIIIKTSGNAIVLIPKPKQYARHLYGLHKNIWKEQDLDSYIREQRNTWQD